MPLQVTCVNCTYLVPPASLHDAIASQTSHIVNNNIESTAWPFYSPVSSFRKNILPTVYHINL